MKDQILPIGLTFGITLLLLASRSLILRLGGKRSGFIFIVSRVLKAPSSVLRRRTVTRPVQVEAQIGTRHFPQF
jgi:hypothetical protein